MNKITIGMKRWITMLAGVAFATGAQAGSTWAFGGTDGGSATTSYSGLTVSGVYAANDTSDNKGFAATTTQWAGGSLLYYSGGGLGMGSDGTGTPNHAIDNNGANTEAVLLNFTGGAQALTGISLGYVSGDADVSVWRYVGGGALPANPTAVGTKADYNGMVAAGWSLVANYADLLDNKNDSTGNLDNRVNLVNGASCSQTTAGVCVGAAASSSSVASSWWLITAYNTSYGGASSALTQGNDYFKIYGVTTAQKVPEPGSLALAGLALGGIFFTRRKYAKR